MTALTIAHVTIHQDENGRYSLNDLFRASGGIRHHRPSKWMANKQTRSLIDELVSETEFGPRAGPNSGLDPVNVIWGGDTKLQGTYVVKELVYAYAMWISPAFNLKVIRAYDALVRGDLDGMIQRLSKFELAYFNKYPNDRVIRQMALRSEPYWYIGKVVQRSAQTVGKAIRRMIEWGLMEAGLLKAARIGVSIMSAHRRKHQHQFTLGF